MGWSTSNAHNVKKNSKMNAKKGKEEYKGSFNPDAGAHQIQDPIVGQGIPVYCEQEYQEGLPHKIDPSLAAPVGKAKSLNEDSIGKAKIVYSSSSQENSDESSSSSSSESSSSEESSFWYDEQYLVSKTNDKSEDWKKQVIYGNEYPDTISIEAHVKSLPEPLTVKEYEFYKEAIGMEEDTYKEMVLNYYKWTDKIGFFPYDDIDESEFWGKISTKDMIYWGQVKSKSQPAAHGQGILINKVGILREGNYSNGRLHGFSRIYNKGECCIHQSYLGKPQGLRISYHSDGCVYYYNKKDEKEHGISVKYNPEGIMIYKREFKDGKLHGKCETFDPKTKKLKSVINMKNDKRHGESIKYNSYGKVILTSRYHYGLKID